MYKSAVFCAAVLLSACASGPSLKSQPLSVNKTELREYWNGKLSHEEFQMNYRFTSGACKTLVDIEPNNSSPYVMYTYLIDSKGRTYERNYHSPSDNAEVNLKMMNGVARNLVYIDGNIYEPTSKNIQRVPVRVTVKRFITDCPEEGKS